jgi:hypothetical protein
MGRMRRRLEKAALVSGMVLATLNVWTGAPLLALWVGSRATGSGSISMVAVLLVVVTMSAVAWVLLRALAWMDVEYRALSGRDRVVHRQLPWLRSMRGERPHVAGDGRPALDVLDYVLVAVVTACVIAFEIWFFFFSTSPIDGRSGRG